jgi:SET domain-containing protein
MDTFCCKHDGARHRESRVTPHTSPVLYRTAFFANDFIKAGTELCYDYGYFSGNVEGKTRACLCGSDNCRKRMY